MSKTLVMKHTFLAVVLLLATQFANAQYKNDNVLYKTVDPSDLCATLDQNKGYIILDVRSREEHNDTARQGVYNLGHLKGAMNIDIQELDKRLAEIRKFQDAPVFIYCSHSQRSRRASKMLADSGFNKVFNINGGMTALYYTQANEKGCLPGLLQSNNKYKIISGTEICQRLNADKNDVFVLDVRPDSAYRHISLEPHTNAYGTVKGSVNIPVIDLPAKISVVPMGKDIIVIDLNGSDAAKAAALLKDKGYARVSVLIEGMARWLITDESDPSCKKQWYVPAVSYAFLTPAGFGQFSKDHKDYLVLDVRSADEFANKHKDSWRNIGHVNNAINIPSAELVNRANDIAAYKNKDVILYAFSTSPEVFAAAQALQQQGFTKVNVLLGGVFNLRWTAANRKGMSPLKDFVVDVPEINW
jgi:rhodanese-related sulfurtransferase